MKYLNRQDPTFFDRLESWCGRNEGRVRRGSMITIALMFMALFVFTDADAKPHQLTIEWPVTTCDGDALALTDLVEAELIYDEIVISMPSDTAGPCPGGIDPDAPAGIPVVDVPVTATATTTVILNLQPGQTYYTRARVSAYFNDWWSSWSTPIQFTVPYGRPNVIRLSGLFQLQYEEIGVTHIQLGKHRTSS